MSRARRRDPNNPYYAGTLGWVHYKMNNYLLAIDHLLFSANSGQPDAESYYRLGMAYYRKGDHLLARETLEKAMELGRSFPGAEEASRVLRKIG